MAKHNILGERGEDIAVDYLQQKGYLILFRNWRYKHYEIDIIATDKGTLVIVEVKTRSTSAFGEPEFFVDLKKQNRLIEATEAFIEQTNYYGETRFDVVAITLNKGSEPTVNHIIDAFIPLG
ncbi:MAG: YraN family protein [Bacteroidales bacterium]